MFNIMIMSMITIIMTVGLMAICFIVSKKSNLDREKSTPFECGFDPQSSARIPFSMQFFLIAILFLIFDIEIVILLPMIIVLKMNFTLKWMITSVLFILILIGGLFHEWNNGILNWKY
uniref:NADH-ubiquinone oxidoreductase chain 3 n=1 Tax=Thaumastocoris safordi TaxID=1589682 RepID=A0A8T9ZYN1_9HEMI|nr:NADH dehydrogenase subunit 3 [Thaumastocoris safordi]